MTAVTGEMLRHAATYVDECGDHTGIEKVEIIFNEKANQGQVTITGESGDYERVYLLPEYT